VHPIRTLLAHVGREYVFEPYADTPEGEAAWKARKAAQAAEGFAFPNLPYYVDERGATHTQSIAIMRSIGRAHGLVGFNEASQASVDVWVDQAVDFRRVLSGAVYSGKPSFDELAATIGPSWLAGFEAALGQHGGLYAAGSALSIADFVLCEALAHARAMLRAKAGVDDVLAPFPRLAALVARFEKLPKVAAFLASDASTSLDWNGTEALFRR